MDVIARALITRRAVDGEEGGDYETIPVEAPDKGVQMDRTT